MGLYKDAIYRIVAKSEDEKEYIQVILMYY